jgi:hypothetical protein
MSGPEGSRRGPRNIDDVLDDSESNYQASVLFSEHSGGASLISVTPARPVTTSPPLSNAAVPPATQRAASDPIVRLAPGLNDLPQGLFLHNSTYAARLHFSAPLIVQVP